MDAEKLRRLAAKAKGLADATPDDRLAATLREIARDFEDIADSAPMPVAAAAKAHQAR